MPSFPIGRRREALRLLGLQDPVEPSEVVSAYRRLARQHHPDLGGDPDVFGALTVARDLLLADARSETDERARSPAGRSVTVRQRPSRRILRGLRRRLGRRGGARRELD
jgi:curved DNA-binding protein CbpA